ncbi:MAG: type III pantothenate kinase [Spirochaetes bacterium]|nr:type III pantothenate kinase [Spirochaetota bacterium]
MKRILLLDIGNSTHVLTLFGPVDWQQAAGLAAVATPVLSRTSLPNEQLRPAGVLAEEIRRILEIPSNWPSVDSAVTLADDLAAFVCSVVPALAAAAATVFADLGIQAVVLDSTMAAGVLNPYKEPGRLGADRLAAAAGARLLFPGKDCIIVDCGTACTVDALCADAAMAGGYIVPGPATWLGSLRSGTAQLPSLELQLQGELGPGRTTAACIANGLRVGYPAMLDGLCRTLQATVFVDRSPMYLFCGGWAAMLMAALKETIPQWTGIAAELSPDLLARGALYMGLSALPAVSPSV